MTSVSALSEIDFTDVDNFATGFPLVVTYAEILAVLEDPVTYTLVSGGSHRHTGIRHLVVELAA